MKLPLEGDRARHAARLFQKPLIEKLKLLQIHTATLEVHLRAFKKEQSLEVWVKNKSALQWQLFTQYSFCHFSGKLGPKRKEGDLQIPEGFYHIDRFNPKSKFYLSLGLNYPNAADRILSDQQQPGSDIFIHGGCATVGCIPITNEKIAELYTLSSMAFEQGQEEIPVHIFPAKMTKEQIELMTKTQPEHSAFWQQLKISFDYFESNKRLPVFEVEQNGVYVF